MSELAKAWLLDQHFSRWPTRVRPRCGRAVVGSQPAASAGLASLQREVGVPLVDHLTGSGDFTLV